MNRLTAFLVVCSIFLGVWQPVSAADGLENFQKKQLYEAGRFDDVSPSDWFYWPVVICYEYGLMSGTSPKRFSPDGTVTFAEAVAIACRLHNIYHGGDGVFEQSSPWYQSYVNYAKQNGIVSSQSSVSAEPATRTFCVDVICAALPEEVFDEINHIADGTIPDVAFDKSLYLLYRAGILSGKDAYGSFHPRESIQRSEFAAMISRVIKPEQRLRFQLARKQYDKNVRSFLTQYVSENDTSGLDIIELWRGSDKDGVVRSVVLSNRSSQLILGMTKSVGDTEQSHDNFYAIILEPAEAGVYPGFLQIEGQDDQTLVFAVEASNADDFFTVYPQDHGEAIPEKAVDYWANDYLENLSFMLEFFEQYLLNPHGYSLKSLGFTYPED